MTIESCQPHDELDEDGRESWLGWPEHVDDQTLRAQRRDPGDDREEDAGDEPECDGPMYLGSAEPTIHLIRGGARVAA